MELELFKIHVGYFEGDKEQVDDIAGFVINEKSVCLDKDKQLSGKAKLEIVNKWNYKQCSLLAYKKFEIDRLPKDYKQFSWLVFHHFNALTSKIANQADLKNKIETFLDAGD